MFHHIFFLCSLWFLNLFHHFHILCRKVEHISFVCSSSIIQSQPCFVRVLLCHNSTRGYKYAHSILKSFYVQKKWAIYIIKLTISKLKKEGEKKRELLIKLKNKDLYYRIKGSLPTYLLILSYSNGCVIHILVFPWPRPRSWQVVQQELRIDRPVVRVMHDIQGHLGLEKLGVPPSRLFRYSFKAISIVDIDKPKAFCKTSLPFEIIC